MSSTFQSGHALLIGAGADLPFTIDDARGLADILKDPERCAYPPEQVELLTGEAASRQAVLDALDRLAKRADQSSTALIYFSGHGYRASTPIADAYFLIPFGVDMGRLKDTAISGSEFAAKLQAIRAKKLLLLLDCCHAGGVGLAKGLELAKSPLPPEALQILEAGRGRVIIASCMESELSYGGKPYSAFTLALIEALSGRGASKQDGFVRAADLALYSREKVPGRTKGRQHPIMHFEEADNFQIAYYAGGEAKPKGLPFEEEPEIEPEPGAWSGVFDQRGQTVQTQTNIAGSVHGPFFSGQFSGPVAMGGEAIDMRGTMGAIYKPTGPVSQQFGDRIEIHGDGNVVGDGSRSTTVKDSILTLIEKLVIEAAPNPPIPYQVPRPPKDFEDRDKELEAIFKEINSGAEIISLRGIGGVGKTDLALVLAGRLRERCPDGQLFLDMRGTRSNPLKPAEAMAQVVRAYSPAARIPDDPDEMRGLYLSTLAGKHALLLADNVAGREQVEPLMAPAGYIMLITSRQKFFLPGMKAIDLDILPEDDAAKLLIANAGRIGEHAKELAELCGYLPLALRNASGALAENVGIGVEEYLRGLQDAKKRLGLVDASFSLSYDLLSTEKRELWSMLSVFPADFDRFGAAAVWAMEPEQAAEALSELVKWSLVNFLPSGASEGGRYRLHDLARIFAQARQEEEQKAAVSQRHASYYKDLLSAANDLYLQGGDSILAGLALFDREEANILAGETWAAKSMEKDPAAAEMCMRYPDAGVYVLDLRLHPRQKIAWLDNGLEAARRLKDRSMEGAHLGNLGIAYAALGEPRKAIEFYEQHLTIARKIGDRRGEGAELGNLGIAYAALGETRKAIEFYERQLVITREIGDRRGEGNALGNLGIAYKNLGEPRKAIEFYERQLVITREIGDRRGEGNALGNLGIAYKNLGEPRKAIEFYEQALAIDREIGDRRGEGADLGNLGNAYAFLGEPRKAIEFYEQALKIAREIGDRRNEGNWLGNLGIAYKNLGEPRKAIEYYEQALAIAREIGDRGGEAIDCWNLGLEYEEAGDLQRAAEMMQIYVDFEREVGHPDAEKDADRLESLKAKLGSRG